MKKWIAVFLSAVTLCMGLGVAGCGDKDPESIVSEKVDAQGWYTAFESAYLALCDGEYFNDGTARQGKFPKNSNCKVTYSDERTQVEKEAIFAGDRAYLKSVLQGITVGEVYVQREEDGNLTLYSKDDKETWSSGTMASEEWEGRFLYNHFGIGGSAFFNDVLTFLAEGYTEFVYTRPNGEPLDDELWQTLFVYDDTRGGYVQQRVGIMGIYNYTDVVYKIADGKLSAVLLSGDSRSLIKGDEIGDGCKGELTFVYGGQSVEIPSIAKD